MTFRSVMAVAVLLAGGVAAASPAHACPYCALTNNALTPNALVATNALAVQSAVLAELNGVRIEAVTLPQDAAD